MSNTRPVREVTVTYTDGESETFTNLHTGFHRTKRNNKVREQSHENVWLEHEIRWSEQTQ